MHHVAAARRMEHHHLTSGLPSNLGKKMQEYNRAVLRYVDYDYRRNSRQLAAPRANTDEEVKPADGTAHDPPGEDDNAPETTIIPPSSSMRRRRHFAES